MSNRAEVQAKITKEVGTVHAWIAMISRDAGGTWPTKLRTSVFVTEASGETVQFEVETLMPKELDAYEESYFAWLKREVLREAKDGLP